MSELDPSNFKELWEKWGRSVSTLSLLVALLALLLGGGWFYNQWRKPNLVYQVLASYELSDQVFSGIVVANSGRSAVTDLELVIDDLGTEIIQVAMPGAHETVELISGGTAGSTDLRLHMDRMTAGTDLSVYFLTKERPNISDSILITSSEMKGKPLPQGISPSVLVALGVFYLVAILSLTSTLVKRRSARRRLLERVTELEALSKQRLAQQENISDLSNNDK